MTLVSRVFGYVRDLSIAVLLGTSFAADAFVIAFRLPNLLRRLTADGAMTSAFVPVFTSYRSERGDEGSWDFARSMFWTLASVLAGLTLLGWLFAPEVVRLLTLASDEAGNWSLAVLLTRITFPYCALIGLAALAGATLNSLKVFDVPASAPIFLNLSIIGAAVVAWVSGYSTPAVALAVGVVVGGALQFLIQVPSLLKHGMRFRPRLGFAHPGVRRVAKLMVPAVAGVGIYQVNVLVSTIFASQTQGWISALYYADRVMEVVLGVYAISVATVLLPVLSQQAMEKKLPALRQTLTFSLRNVAFIVVPAAAGLIVLREPIVRTLFEHRAFGSSSSELTAIALLFYAVGLPAFAAVRLLVQGFYATEDTRTPVQAAGLALLANVVLCFVLVGRMGLGGLALATSVAAYLNFGFLYFAFRRRLGRLDEGTLALSLGRTLVAATGMALVCAVLGQGLGLFGDMGFARLAGGCLLTVGMGMATFFGLAWSLRAGELGEVFTLITGRQPGIRMTRLAIPVPSVDNR